MYMQGGQGGGGYGGGGGGMSPYPGGPGNSYPGGGPGGGYQGQGGGPPGGPSGYPGGGPGHYVGGGYPQHQGGGQHPGGGHPGGGAGGPGQGHGMQHPSSYNQYSGHSGGPMGSQMGGQMGSQMGGMGGYGGGGGGGGNGNQMPGGGYGGQHMGGQMGPIVPHTGQMGGYKGGQMGPPGNQPGHYGGPQDGGHGGPSGPGPQWSGGPGSPGSYHQGSANGYGNQGGKGYGGEKGGKDNAGKGGKGGKGGGRGRGGKGQEQYGGGGDRNNYGGHQEQNQYDSQFSSLNLGMGGAMGQLGAGKGKHSNGNPPGTALVPHQHKGGKAGNAGNAGAMYGQGYGGGGGGGYEYGAGKGRGKQQVPHSNLFIGNLPEDATEAMLREAFLAHGTIQSCRVFTRNGRTCALLKMGSVAEAERAVKGSASGDVKSRWLVKYADADVGGAADKGGGKDGGFGQLYKGNFSKGGGGAAAGGFGWNSSGKGSGSGQPRRREREQTDATPSDNLYVKGLPPRITEAQLHRTFSKVGKVVELKILRYGDSLECAALVRMANIEASKACIEQLNGKAPEGAVPPLTIRFHGKDPATTSDNLYVKGLPLNFTQDMLNLLFGQCGTMRRSRILAPRREMPDDVTLDSAALVQMSSPEEAAAAIQMLNGRVPEGVGPQMVIRYAEQKAGATGGASSTWTEPTPTDNLYVKGLPLGTPDFLLRAVFAQFGTVVRLKVLEPRGGEALDCAALVQMASIDESKASCAALHGRVLAAPLPPMRVRFAGKDQQPGSNLYVAGLPVTIHEQQLRATFAQSGTVVRLRLLVQCGRPETHALVQMASFEEAEKAITTLHGTPPESLGPTLVVRYATKRARDRDRAPGDAAPAVDDEAAAAIEDGEADAGEAEKKLADAEFDEMAAAAEGGAEDLEDDAAPIESSDAAPLSAPLEALKSLTAESVAEAGMEPMEPYLPAEGDDDDASFDEAP